ncbi:MAG TPA: hypothetical protein VJS45_18445 [Acidimicrobiia bacterium]|nr:hypothetical protein [Acidimicrobiia bacterium]
MKLGSLPRGLAVAAITALTVVPLAASPAVAAPAAPTAYAMFGKAEPFTWGGSSGAVGSLHVPFVWGKTNNASLAKSEAKLFAPDESPKPLAGDAIAGLQCVGFDEKSCKDPFVAQAQVEHAGPDARVTEKAANWPGKDGKFPGNIRAVTNCGGNCGPQLVHTVGGAAGSAGALTGYVSVGSSSASHDLSIDDKGRLVSFAKSQLDNVTIGPKSEVQFSSLVTTAQAVGAGSESSKDGRADVRVNDLRILGYPVELTRAGLRLANGGPSEQEAYDGAKALLQRLKDEHGIILEIPNFDAQLTKAPAHVSVVAEGLRVTFRQGVGYVNASALAYPLQFGHSTAVVAALDAPGRTMNVNDSGGVPTVEDTPQAAPAPPKDAASPPTSRTERGTSTPKRPTGDTKDATPPRSEENRPEAIPPIPGALPSPPAEVGPEPPVNDGAPVTNPEEVSLPSLDDVQRKLGLRGAQSVSRAFGAFLGLGLILPLARFVIRRLG